MMMYEISQIEILDREIDYGLVFLQEELILWEPFNVDYQILRQFSNFVSFLNQSPFLNEGCTIEFKWE